LLWGGVDEYGFVMVKRQREPAPFEVPANMPGTDQPAPGGVVIWKVDGQAVIVPRALRNLEGESLRAVARLQLLARQRVDLEDELEDAVMAGRAVGLSYASIGWCFGVSGQAVRMAYGA